MDVDDIVLWMNVDDIVLWMDVDDIVHLLKTHGSPVWCPSLGADNWLL